MRCKAGTPVYIPAATVSDCWTAIRKSWGSRFGLGRWERWRVTFGWWYEGMSVVAPGAPGPTQHQISRRWQRTHTFISVFRLPSRLYKCRPSLLGRPGNTCLLRVSQPQTQHFNSRHHDLRQPRHHHRPPLHGHRRASTASQPPPGARHPDPTLQNNKLRSRRRSPQQPKLVHAALGHSASLPAEPSVTNTHPSISFNVTLSPGRAPIHCSAVGTTAGETLGSIRQTWCNTTTPFSPPPSSSEGDGQKEDGVWFTWSMRRPASQSRPLPPPQQNNPERQHGREHGHHVSTSGGADLRIVRQMGAHTRDEAACHIRGQDTPMVGEGILVHQVYRGREDFEVAAMRFEAWAFPWRGAEGVW
ncbi:hypothetical protein BT67DRAFT_443921 [Trichocladium antarcticum]|uniref:Uncharacterized protein n=1 Tax=Trichocladium antarcticum TaxID=1450529 RepID=A0AAN6ZCG7_9PEZI|nr:hypothetical protein BT67DRAFT_443921 [Trichocladium antarcticum]